MKIFNKKGNDSPERSLLAIVSSDDVRQAVEKITTVMPGLDLKVKKTDDTLQNGGTLVNGSADLVLIKDWPFECRFLRLLSLYGKVH